MKCKTCEYELWDIKPPGPCPECGTEFHPTDYRFRPGAVHFLCPHCGVAYQGNGADGLPSPKSFACVKCGGAVDAALMAVRIPEGSRPEPAVAIEAPWPARTEIGLWRAAMRTIGWSLVRPSAVVRGLEKSGGLKEAFGFAMLVHAFVIGVYALIFCVVWIATIGSSGGPASAAIGGFAFSAGMVVFGAALYAGVIMPIYALAAHAILLVTGEHAGGPGLTLRTLYYAQGVQILNLIPGCGGYISPLWTLVSSALMLREAQRVSKLRAALAVIAPPIAIIGLTIGLVVWAFTSAMGGRSTLTASVSTSGPSAISAAFIAAKGTDGHTPGHMLSVYEKATMQPLMFDAPTSTGSAMLADGRPTQSLRSMTNDEIHALGEAWTDAETFYVVGSYIFSHRGVDLNTAPGGLWLAFTDPRDPGASMSEHGALSDLPTFVVLDVHLTDGTRATMTGQWGKVVSAQNSLRALAGLPPIPLAMKDLPSQPPAAAPDD